MLRVQLFDCPAELVYTEMPLADQRYQERMRRPLPVVVRWFTCVQSRGEQRLDATDVVHAAIARRLRPSADAYGPLAAPVVDG